jgi:dephospho-CoA kinase
MKKIALTGGIACGKSLVGQYMAEEGFPVCDSDGVAHELMAPGTPVCEGILREFGLGVAAPDGGIDRGRLGRVVFADPAELARLNRLVHPAVAQAVAGWLAARPPETRAAVVIIPLLFEAGMDEGWDGIISVISPASVQWARLLERGLTPGEARQRLAAQWALAKKMERADWVIFNGGTREMLKEQVKAVLRRMVES